MTGLLYQRTRIPPRYECHSFLLMQLVLGELIKILILEGIRLQVSIYV